MLLLTGVIRLKYKKQIKEDEEIAKELQNGN